MDELLGRIQHLIDTVPPAGVLLVSLLSGVMEAIFPPFPGEGVLLIASFSAARRRIEPWQIAAVSALGSFLSLYALYSLGRGRLREPVRRLLRKSIGRAEQTVRTFFDRWGYRAVLLSRFLPAVRGPLTFLAGVYHLKRLPTAIALLAGCIVWNSLVVWLGYRAGSSWDGSKAGLVWGGLILAGTALGLWALGAGLYRLIRRSYG